MSDKPQWECLDDRRKKAMVNWVNDQLDGQILDDDKKDYLAESELCQKIYREANRGDWSSVVSAMRQADRGNLSPLNRIFPCLQPYLTLPKLKKASAFRRMLLQFLQKNID